VLVYANGKLETWKVANNGEKIEPGLALTVVPMARSVGAAAPTAARLDEIYAYCKDEVLGWSFVCTEKESARLAA
jgi:hypothetical protein